MVSFEVVDEGNFLIHLDKELLWTEGRQLIKEFLVILQTYKSTGSIDRAQKFWNHYSKVDGIFLDIRKIVLEKKKPRRLELNNNLVRYNSECIEAIVYPSTFEGIIMSYADRYPCNKKYLDQVLDEWI